MYVKYGCQKSLKKLTFSTKIRSPTLILELGISFTPSLVKVLNFWELASLSLLYRLKSSRASRHIVTNITKLCSKKRSTSLCLTCLSRIHGLCRSDHPFPNFSPILHCNSTLLMSNSVIMKTRLFRSDFSFHKANFTFVYHCLYRSGQKVKRSNDKQSNLPD